MEEVIETQESVGTEPATEQTMLGESPLRTIVSLLEINQLATGTVQFALSPLMKEDMKRTLSVPPLMGIVA